MTDLRRLAQLCAIIDHMESRPDDPALVCAKTERDALLGAYVAEVATAARIRGEAPPFEKPKPPEPPPPAAKPPEPAKHEPPHTKAPEPARAKEVPHSHDVLHGGKHEPPSKGRKP